MIPSSAFAFFAFLLILIPGFAFTLSRARYKPARKESALQETSRVLSSSLLANMVAGGLLYRWWSPPVRKLVNGQAQDLFQAYVDALIPLAGIAVASSVLAFAVGEIRYRPNGGHQRQESISVLDNAFSLGKGESSIAFITMTDGAEVAGQVARYDNAPEAPQHFLEVATPYWTGSTAERRGMLITGARLVMPIPLVKTLQIQLFDPEKCSVEDLLKVFPISGHKENLDEPGKNKGSEATP